MGREEKYPTKYGHQNSIRGNKQSNYLWTDRRKGISCNRLLVAIFKTTQINTSNMVGRAGNMGRNCAGGFGSHQLSQKDRATNTNVVGHYGVGATFSASNREMGKLL